MQHYICYTRRSIRILGTFQMQPKCSISKLDDVGSTMPAAWDSGFCTTRMPNLRMATNQHYSAAQRQSIYRPILLGKELPCSHWKDEERCFAGLSIWNTHEKHDTTTTATSFVWARSVQSISLKKCRKTRLVTVGPYKNNPSVEEKTESDFYMEQQMLTCCSVLQFLQSVGRLTLSCLETFCFSVHRQTSNKCCYTLGSPSHAWPLGDPTWPLDKEGAGDWQKGWNVAGFTVN